MSVWPAAPTHKSEQELVAESVPPPIEIAASTAAVPPQPTRRSIHSTRVGVVGNRPVPAALPLDLRSPQHHPRDLGLFESARLEREMAREMHLSSAPPNQQSPMSIAAALARMSFRRSLILATGILLLTGALLALWFPVFLSDFDQWGSQITCGSGFQSTSTQAGIADSAGTHFADQCHTAIAMRRAWTIPLVAAGILLLSALLVRPSRQHSTSAEAAREIPSARLSWPSPSACMPTESYRSSAPFLLLDRDRLGQIPRLVDVVTAGLRHRGGEHLQWNGRQ
jgi:hypothetical protein